MAHVKADTTVLGFFLAEGQENLTEMAQELAAHYELCDFPSGHRKLEIENSPYLVVAVNNKRLQRTDRTRSAASFWRVPEDFKGRPDKFRAWSFQERSNADLLFQSLLNAGQITCWIVKRRPA